MLGIIKLVQNFQYQESLQFLIEMRRESSLNPLDKLLKMQTNFSISRSPQSKSFKIDNSKQNFFTLKKNNSRRLTISLKNQQPKKTFTKNKNHIFFSPSIQNNENEAHKISVCQEIRDDDNKTTSTIEFDTQEQISLKASKYWNRCDKTNVNLSNQRCQITSRNSTVKPSCPSISKQVQVQLPLLSFKPTKKKLSASTNLHPNMFYFFSHPIGNGSYSTVYKCVHKLTGFVCAIKVIQMNKILELGLLDNLVEEIKVMTVMGNQHQNLNQLYAVFKAYNFIYMVMEYSTDGQLFKLIKKFQPQQINNLNIYKQKLNYIRQVCSAVQFLHENNVMHRDIKPENILITMKDHIKVTDFGWSKILHSSGDQLRKTMCGTPLYLAPQQIKQNTYNKSIDNWAIGILTFQLLTGKIPFEISSIQDLGKIVTEEIDFQLIQAFPFAKQFVGLLLEKNGNKRSNFNKLSTHNFFDVLEEFDEQKFMFQIQFGKLI